VDDVLGYAGRRVIVSGAASDVGAATMALLVEFGAEVHAVDAHKPQTRHLASFSEVDLRDAAGLGRAVERIGSVVNAFFHCADGRDLDACGVVLVTFAAYRLLVEHVVPLMIEGAAIATVAPTVTEAPATDAAAARDLVATADFDGVRAWFDEHGASVRDSHAVVGEAFDVDTAPRSVALAARGVRCNVVHADPATSTADERAWALVLLNSPRASALTGTTPVAGRAPTAAPSASPSV
jgi:NAD(P)-dependent dehydrogenase (short-subunit alcohol dehydrogenase family)